jgi:hypothetical protein
VKIELNIPKYTDRELEEAALMRYCRDISSPTNFPFWYNPMKDHVPTPKSEYWHLSFEEFTEMLKWAYGDSPKWEMPRSLNVADWVNHNVGFPFFLKTGTFSGKHDWRDTCFVRSAEYITWHIRHLYYMSECMNAPATPTIVAREFLECDYWFTAFGGTPITTEVRLFSKEGGQVDSWQHYWSDEALEGRLADADWAVLRDMQEKAKAAIPKLIADTENALRKSGLSYMEWSVDWLLGSNGNWYMIDMAERQTSYVSTDIIRIKNK